MIIVNITPTALDDDGSQYQEVVINKPYHHGDLRAALLAAAADLLDREGAEGVSLRAVARAVGVSQTAPYNHFDSKEALLVALAAEGFSALRRSQQQALATLAAGSNALEALGSNYVSFATEKPQRYRLMFGLGLKDRSMLAAVAKVKRASFEPLHTVLRARSVNLDPATLDAEAVAAWAFVHGLASLVIDGSLRDDAAAGATSLRVRRAIATFAQNLG
ncbi:TetR/AcrR family transcriptional regulator [Bradyrhizobium sp. STM 3809]|uniref:TetR/AcrR family transcriptional regulator n=1 Tax=Bradyrhizobium sp. STM 3809 TaxID=551936 RepID=UPI000240927A|nr:TetR/AcrR family transcriptional regulator [Bradyrhizobium sp. STM 3809]CCE00726.1 putative transcriptional regulator, TetR family [Bradyrhizobium sp. STM 3809]